jgi:hypothetical protein
MERTELFINHHKSQDPVSAGPKGSEASPSHSTVRSKWAPGPYSSLEVQAVEGVEQGGRHAGPGQQQKLTAHSHSPPIQPAAIACTFQEERRSERRERAGAGAKAS